ncbi:MAG: sugar phosphate isomerase/epimerase [Thermomicrobiales bacterium]|nr:sugar phosphate isomerase/epimerase [Thermomicrobiales bacterium]
MNIAMQTARLPGDSLLEKFQFARTFGFDGVEINLSPTVDLADIVDELNEASAASGVPIAALCSHGSNDPLQPDPGLRAERFAALTRLLELADQIGADGIVCVPVRRPVEFPDLSEPELFAFAVAEFRAWAATLPAGNARIFFEPLNRFEATFLRRVEQGVALAAAVDHPRVQALADLFHMNIEEASMSAPILDAGAWLGHVHIADNNRLQPGAGCLDFSVPFRAFKSIGYDGWLTIESALGGPLAADGPTAMLPETVRFLRVAWASA